MTAPLQGLKRRARLGLRAEMLIVLPVALLLLVVLSTFTLFSYRAALLGLTEERQTEAKKLARGLADRLTLARAGGPDTRTALLEADLRGLAPAARGLALLDGGGRVLAMAGDVTPVPAGFAAGGGGRRGPWASGPDGELPDGVAGFAPLAAPAGRLLVARVDLPAVTLGVQLQAVGVLLWLVLPVNSALVLLVLFLLRHLLTPYETLLARARELGGPADASEDEAAFLIATVGRALEALSLPQPADLNVRAAADAEPRTAEAEAARGADDDLAAVRRTLASSVGSGLLLLGRDGSVLSLNALGAELLAAGAAQPAGSLESLLAHQPQLLAILRGAIAAGDPVQRRECLVERPGQAPLPLGLSVHPLRRDDGATRGYLVLFADLTEARRRAAESQLSDRLATLGEMAAGAAHELRNSLATLRGYLTLVERRPDEESVGGFLAEMRHEADHLQRVLEDFLAFARPGTARLESFSMIDLVRRAAADPALAGVAVRVRPAGDGNGGGNGSGGGRLRGDPQLVERALRNVLHNAAQAERDTGRAGPVEMTVEEQPAGVAIEVADRGAGVPASLRSRLFHPFATGRAGGVGLGLALAHRIVTLHGGSIRLDDRPGGGTVARLFFARDTFATEGNSEAAVDRPPTAVPSSS